MITFERFSYTYPNGAAPAVAEVSLAIRPGAFVLLTGPSGAGKSTLLRAINGLVPHFSGGVVSGRVEVAGLDPIALGPTVMSGVVGFVFQNPEAQAVLDTVEAEVAFGLENGAVPAGEMRQRVNDVLQTMGITALRQRRLETLSGGERQKVAIATALALRPQILVLDEPTSQLDAESAEELLQALVELHQAGLTIVLSEHRLKRILPYVTRVVEMEEGGLVIGDRGLGIGERLRKATPHTPRPTPHAPRPTPYALEVKNLHFAYGDVPILNGFNLAVRPGECVVLRGRNGAGKTTLLRCVVGLFRPGEGQILVNGQEMAGQSVADICRQMAYLPQNPDDLLFAETVRGELLATLNNHEKSTRPRHWLGWLFGERGLGNGDRSPISNLQSPISDLLHNLGLTGYADAYPRDLSVGQRQRVALGAVMVTQPKLLLLDEPTRGLDLATKQQLATLWRDWLDKGMGLLLVTHDAELAGAMADRVVQLA